MKNVNKNQNCHSLSKFYLRNKESYHKMPYLAHAQGMTGESGRSMVEMLGVLAVIGVLSVGGIAGYKMAMTKHKANELLNEASKRAVVVAAKIAAGQFNASTALNEFGNDKVQGVSFTSSYTNGATTFDLTLTWDADSNKSAVCNQMKNIAGENGVPKIETNCDKITYNVDLSTGGNNTPNTSGIESDEPVEVVEECPYEGGGDTTNQMVKYEDEDWWAMELCHCPDDRPFWNGTDCVAETTLNDCSSNSDCDSGEYCRYTQDDYISYECTGDHAPVTGKCAKIANIKKIGDFYLFNDTRLDYYSAKNWCEAIPGNHRLAQISDFNCMYPSDNYHGLVHPDYYASDLYGTSMWTSEDVLCCDIYNPENDCSLPLQHTLEQNGMYLYRVWLSDSEGDSEGDCWHLNINLEDGYVFGARASQSTKATALCK